MPEGAFDAVQRARLAALADVLIPAVDGVPAAADAGATGKWLDRAVTARPELVAPLERIASLPGEDDPRASLERLIAEDAEGFAALTAAVSGAYYMNLKIRKRIGYPGQKHNPPYPDEAEYYLEGLLEPVLERGPLSPEPPPDQPKPPHTRGRRANGKMADVLVIGAGAGGSVAARHLAEAGFDVVCLEQGGWLSPSDFPGDKLEFELLVEREWNASPNIRQRPEDYPCETSESDVEPVMFNAVGGSTIHYGAQWARMRPADFRVRTLEGVADDWPISYEDLLAHY